MKKILTSLLFIFAGIISKSQSYTITTMYGSYGVTIGKDANKFFKSYEDYLSSKAIEGVKLVELNPNSIKYSDNGTEQKVKASKLTYSWFCNSDGMLMRVFDGEIYYVIVDGPLCLYICSCQGSVVKPDKYEYLIRSHSEYFPAEHFSLTPDGPIEKLKEKVVKEYLDKYNLFEQYENDPNYKRERKDCVACFENKKTNKQIKYFKIINSKMK